MKFPCRAGYVRRAARGRRRTIGMTRDEAVRGGVSRVACRVSRCAMRDARCARIACAARPRRSPGAPARIRAMIRLAAVRPAPRHMRIARPCRCARATVGIPEHHVHRMLAPRHRTAPRRDRLLQNALSSARRPKRIGSPLRIGSKGFDASRPGTSRSRGAFAHTDARTQTKQADPPRRPPEPLRAARIEPDRFGAPAAPNIARAARVRYARDECTLIRRRRVRSPAPSARAASPCPARAR